MLDRDLARLAAVRPDLSLAGLEQAIWSRVEGLNRLRHLERVTSGVQLLALGGALVASIAVGVAVTRPPASRQAVLRISSAAADLAPSTLLGVAR